MAQKRACSPWRGAHRASPCSTGFWTSLPFLSNIPFLTRESLSRRLQKTPQPIVTQALGKCLPWAVCVNRKRPCGGLGQWGSCKAGAGRVATPSGLGGWRTGLIVSRFGAIVALDAGNAEEGGMPEEAGSRHIWGMSCTQRLEALSPLSPLSPGVPPCTHLFSSTQFPLHLTGSPSSWFSDLGWVLGSWGSFEVWPGSWQSDRPPPSLPPSFRPSFLLPLPPLPAQEQQTNKQPGSWDSAPVAV